jgi:hypothetical protein
MADLRVNGNWNGNTVVYPETPSQTPHIDVLLSELDKNLAGLDEELHALEARLDGVLMQPAPTNPTPDDKASAPHSRLALHISGFITHVLRLRDYVAYIKSRLEI